MGTLTWPNALTLLRFPLAVAFLLADSTLVRSAIVATAGLSDFLDGLIARRTGQRSRIGELLDPIADKTFVFLALIGFVWTGELAVWELLLVLARDIFTGTASIITWAMGVQRRFPPRRSGKIVTTLQIATLLVLLLLPGWARPVVLATGLMSVAAAVDYAVAGLRGLRQGQAGT